jgi:hypothetical protein
MPPTMLIFERLAYHEAKLRKREEHRTSSGAGPDEEHHDAVGDVEIREDVAALKALGEPLTWDLIHVRRTKS